MTPEERALLTGFLADLRQPSGAAKDREADQMIHDAVSANPDAVYLLVQHAILSDQALHAALAQIEQIKNRETPGLSGSFLSPSGGATLPLTRTPDVYAPAAASPWAGQQGAPVPSNPFAANSGLGGFLRSAGTMAAGVAAGDFLAEGISNIFGSRW